MDPVRQEDSSFHEMAMVSNSISFLGLSVKDDQGQARNSCNEPDRSKALSQDLIDDERKKYKDTSNSHQQR